MTIKRTSITTFISVITLEPALMFYFISSNFSRFLQYNLLLRKACDSSLLYEPDLSEKCLNEAEAQHRVADINTWKSLLISLLPMIFLLIAGPWSDNHGNRRRPLIFIPIIGQMITDLLCCLNAYYWNWAPEIAAVFEILGSGLTGGESCLIAGSICYVCDVCEEKNRTWRLSIIVLLYVTCGPIGAGFAGIINIKFGFIKSFLLSVFLNMIAVSFAIILIKDTSKPYDKSVSYSISSIIGLDNLVNCMKMLSKPRNHLKRIMLNISVFLRSVVISRIAGEGAVIYLFVRYKFNWNEIDYSYFSAYRLLTVLIGTLFSMGLLSYRLRVSDPLIGIIGATVDTVAIVMFIFVNTSLQMYLVTAVDMFNGAAYTITTSMCTKCVESDELGKCNTVKALGAGILPIIVSPIYSQIYSLTFERFPSTFFIISLGLSVPTVILFCVTYRLHTKQIEIIAAEKEIKDTQA